MRDRRLLFVVVCLAGPGCPAFHERPSGDAAVTGDAGPIGRDAAAVDGAMSTCLPDGVYSVTATFVSASPEGCLGGTMPSTFDIHVPPIQQDYSGMCPLDTVTITRSDADPCTWIIESGCAIPDASTRAVGTLSAPRSGIVGRFDVALDSIGGSCTATLALTGAP